MMRTMTSAMLLAAATAALPAAAAAQAPGERSISLLVGGFTYDMGGDATSPMAALRVDRRLSRHLVAELGFSLARAEVTLVDESTSEPVAREAESSIALGTVGLNAELPLAHVRPYAGVAVGMFGRFDPEGGDRFVRPSLAFPLGARADLGDRLGARAEARLRFDEHQGGASAVDTELLAGVTWRF